MQQIEAGIYRHFKGNLYFVDGVVQDAKTEGLTVLYHALYPGPKMGFCREINDFFTTVSDTNNNPVERFLLIHPLSVEKLQMLLPETLVNRIENPSTKPYKVKTVEGRGSDGTSICVVLSHWNDGLNELMDLEVFLWLFLRFFVKVPE